MAPPRRISFSGWLRRRQALERTGAERPLVVGSTGHLMLSESEIAATTARLRLEVLPRIAERAGRSGVMLLMGSAPGSDAVFNTLALDWFAQQGVAYSSVALLPVPPWWLIFDWMQRIPPQGSGASLEAVAEGDSAVVGLLDRADLQVPLYGADSASQQHLRAWRTAQYQKLAACLVEQSDLLVAILRPQHAGEAGGTAQVVDWWRNPLLIPQQLRSARPPGQPPRRGRDLIVIDPGLQRVDTARAVAAAGHDALLDLAQAAMRGGNDLRCYDLLYRARKNGLQSRRMDYLRLQALANVGNTSMALAEYRALQLRDEELSEDWLALQGRLEKDLALAGAADDATPHFLRAAEAYMVAFQRWGGHFSGINAATTLAMAGAFERAREVASDVVAALLARKPDSEIERYYHLATAAEAALHLGDTRLCESSLREADELLVDDVVRRGGTLRQLRRLCMRLGIDPALLKTLRLPPVLLLQRLSRDDLVPGGINTIHLPDLHPATLVFMSLIDPADLALASALQASGAHVYPTLSQPLAELSDDWSRRWGKASSSELAAVLDRAERVASIPGFMENETAWCAHHVQATALGASLLTARRLGCAWNLAEVTVDGSGIRCTPLGAGITDVGADLPRALASSGYRENTVLAGSGERRRMVGIIFADFVGFRRVTDPEMPRFWREIMGSMNTLVEKRRGQVLFSSTWGDALHVVTADAQTAAQIAADIQQSCELRRLRADGPLSQLDLRVAAHFAPAFEDLDPVRQCSIFYGSQLSFAARIEPVTPPGAIFGSEAFVARLMLEAPDRFSADYVGEIELAKNFGTHPVFSLRRRAVAQDSQAS